MNRAVQVVALLAFLAVAAWLGWRQYERHWLETPIAGLHEAVTFEIAPGTPLRSVANALGKQGLLDRPSTWLRHAAGQGLATRIKAGEYRLQPGTTPKTLLEQFVAGDVVLHALTIPEGWTFRQALAAIQANPDVKVELKGLTDAALLERLGLQERRA